MVLLYLSIPVMIVAVAIATLPLLATMRREERLRRAAPAFATGAAYRSDDADEELRAAA